MSMISIYIFANIFLAMTMNSYEENRGRFIKEDDNEQEDEFLENPIVNNIKNWL
jgi:hypothetical protein